ncbi:colicin E3/pyocin S6 family cytotoxin [Leptolyngbya sp. AN03gr2]|uniref:colicin E3/pyocin S6 family cytotoxin n=1 Tax=unclassified Leptolyngbya TaxID=2650499 RepID=UPI003D31BCD6
MPYIPAPKLLQAFPDAKPVKPKTSVQGGGGLRKRWKDEEGNIYEWDSRHGTIEKYDRKGKHLGEFDPITGEQLKPANPDYEVDP